MSGTVPLTLGSTASRSLDAVGLRLTEVRFPAGLRLGLHEHDRASLVVMLEGSMDDRLSGRVRACPPSTFLVEPSGARHANRFGARGGRVVVVQPEPDVTERLGTVQCLFADVHHGLAPAVARLAWRITGELREPDDVTPMLASGLAQEMFALVARQDSTRRHGNGPQWLAIVEDQVRESFEQRIDPAGLAASVGIHPVHLARTFRRFRGMPLGSWVRRLRLDAALDGLARTDDPIVDVAAASGFADQSHLTRVMQRRMGLTPADYRKLARGR